MNDHVAAYINAIDAIERHRRRPSSGEPGASTPRARLPLLEHPAGPAVTTRRLSIRRFPSPDDGVCDLVGGPDGREVGGVNDLGLVMQPGASRLGIGLEVVATEVHGPRTVSLSMRFRSVS